MGTVDAAKGFQDPSFQALLDLQKRDSKCWVKIIGLERASATGKPFHDAIPFATALIDNCPAVVNGIDPVRLASWVQAIAVATNRTPILFGNSGTGKSSLALAGEHKIDRHHD